MECQEGQAVDSEEAGKASDRHQEEERCQEVDHQEERREKVDREEVDGEEVDGEEVLQEAMKLSDARDAYKDYSGKASDLARHLGFAGLAVVWIFSGGGTGTAARIKIEEDLVLPALVIVIALGLDLLQYAYGAIAWGIYGRLQEKKGVGPDKDFLAPNRINWPTLGCFWMKLAAISFAYVLLGIELGELLL